MSDAGLSCPRCGLVNETGESRVIFCVSCGELIDVAKLRAEGSASSSPARPDSVLISVGPGANEMPPAWTDMQTQVLASDSKPTSAHEADPSASDPAALQVDVSDLIADLAFGAESSIAEAENMSPLDASPAMGEPPAVSSAGIDALLEEPKASRPHSASHADQSPTIMMAETPYQMAQALSQAQKQGIQAAEPPPTVAAEQPPTVVAELDSAMLNSPQPRAESFTDGGISFDEIELSAPTVQSPPLKGGGRSTLLDSPSVRLSTEKAPPAATPVSAETAVPQNILPTSVTEARPAVLQSEQKELRPASSAPAEGVDPFADLSNLSAQVKAAEKQIGTKPELKTKPLEDETAPQASTLAAPSTSAASAPAPAPAEPSPAPAPVQPASRPKSLNRPPMSTTDPASSRGLKVDFVSRSANAPAGPPSPQNDPSASDLQTRPNSEPKSQSESADPFDEENMAEEERIASIARPALVVALGKPAIEAEVRLLAVSMTASVKKARVDSQKSLILSGLLFSQAKLLRDRLRGRNIPSKIVDPATISYGYSLNDFGLGRGKGGSLIKASLAISVAAVSIVTVIIIGQSWWSDYQINVTLRESAKRIRTKAMPPSKLLVVKQKNNAPRQDIIPLKEISFGGRSRDWWLRRIKTLRIQERSAPAAQRPQIRIRRQETSRKAKLLGIKPGQSS